MRKFKEFMEMRRDLEAVEGVSSVNFYFLDDSSVRCIVMVEKEVIDRRGLQEVEQRVKEVIRKYCNVFKFVDVVFCVRFGANFQFV